MQPQALGKSDCESKQRPRCTGIEIIRHHVADHHERLYAFESRLGKEVGKAQTLKAAADCKTYAMGLTETSAEDSL